MAITDEHLQVGTFCSSCVVMISLLRSQKLAADGLRVLCLAYKELSPSDYEQWAQKLRVAELSSVSTSGEGRAERVKEVYEEIERNLQLIGATAIEDKLQDGVPQCIENLSRAGIKIWVLTGDKLGETSRSSPHCLTDFLSETARNIGFSCRLLTNAMKLWVIEEENEGAVERQLQAIHHQLSNQAETASSDFGLLITGEALMFALNERLKETFLDIGTRCKAVLCCRATPLQKAQVVDLVMSNDRKITLAIGDGANDVSMIQREMISPSVGDDGVRSL